jgi:AcrR family transcriptional regulator
VKRERYHHGDLRTALVATTIELISERGVDEFSIAEASRRLGVAPSAPYAHFRDRDALLAAVVVHAMELFRSAFERALQPVMSPRTRVVAMARTYVEFAAAHEALFHALFHLRLDKKQHPEVDRAEEAIDGAFREALRALSPGRQPAADEALAAAVEAAIHGHAVLLLDGRFGEGRHAVTRAARSAARSALAVVDGWA